MVTPAQGEGRMLARRYHLQRVLGRGAMGAVWEAEDTFLRRPVAVKEVVLPPGLSPAERAISCERTLREARAIARLGHPNVVTLFDVLDEDTRPWVVMELVPSRSLADVIKTDGPLHPMRVATVGLAILGALEAAHAAGITHRDVKPGNILLGHDGRVKLTDFGIARAAGDTTITGTGLLIGSPSYLAPEIVRGQPAGPPCDLWGLGATLYAAVEGRAPFTGTDAMDTLSKVVQDPPAPFERAGSLAPALLAMLEKDPNRRAGAVEARRRLLEVLRGGDASDVPESGPVGQPPVVEASVLAATVAGPSPLASALDSGGDQAGGDHAGGAEAAGAGGEPRGRHSQDESMPAAAGVSASGEAAGLEAADASGAGTPGTERKEPGHAAASEPAGTSAPAAGPVGAAVVGTAVVGTAPVGAGPVGAAPVGAAGAGAAAAAAAGRVGVVPPTPRDAQAAGEVPTQVAAPMPPGAGGPWWPSGGPPGFGAGTGTPPARDPSPFPLLDPGPGPIGMGRPVDLADEPTQAVAPVREPFGLGGFGAERPALERSRDRTGMAMLIVAGLILALLVGAVLGARALLNKPSGPARQTGATGPSATPTGSAAMPAGFRRYQHPSGFSVGAPDGWGAVPRRAGIIDLREPGSSRFLRLIRASSSADALTQLASAEPGFAKENADYHRLRLAKVSYRGYDAADWEFTYNRNGTIRHVVYRAVVVNGASYGLYASAPEQQWTDSRHFFDVAAATFEPAR